MMKSWADHCSSDEESLGDAEEEHEKQTLNKATPARRVVEVQYQPPPAADDQHLDDEDADDEAEEYRERGVAPPAAPQERVYDFPDKPPFTAFVGNLAFSITEGDDLKHAIVDLVQERLGAQISVIGGRIGVDRRDGRHRGFGYVEVETLEEVSSF
jgi:hypothetical protein